MSSKIEYLNFYTIIIFIKILYSIRGSAIFIFSNLGRIFSIETIKLVIARKSVAHMCRNFGGVHRSVKLVGSIDDDVRIYHGSEPDLRLRDRLISNMNFRSIWSLIGACRPAVGLAVIATQQERP